MKIKLIIFVIVIAIGGFFIYLYSRTHEVTNYPSSGTDIVAFGDSLVFGMGSTEGNNFVSLLSKKIGQPIVNLGHPGNTTADGLASINELNNYEPKVVLLLLGGNDHLKKVPIEDTRKNLSSLIENIQARGTIVLLLGVRGGLFNDRLDTEFEDLSDSYQAPLVPDVLDGLFGDSKYMSDTIHPNDIGYKIIADRIYPVLVGLIE